MKEIALVGTNNKVFADVLSVLMARDVAVNAMVDFPEHVMVEDESLTVSRMDFYDEEAMREAFASYGSLVLTYDDNLLDVAHNNLALRTFADTLTAARKAGVGRVIVVAGQDSEAYFVSLLNRIDISEINRIKKNICAHLNVADQYKDIYNERTNYGVESDFLEFKASCARPPMQSSSLLNDINIQKWTILKAICAFLNSISGGDLLIGVSDNGFALGLDEDILLLYREHMISEPNADRLRTYLKLFIDKGFITADGRVSGAAITAERVKFIIEKNEENREILRVKVTPYPWDVVRISAPDRPNGFHDTYIRTSGASTPLNHAGVREVKLRKLNSLDKNLLKIAKIRQAIDENVIVEIKNYNSVNGLSDRRIEPYKVYDDNKSFLAYDIDRHDMRRFKVSRFRDSDLNVTKDKWKNQKKHADRSVDIFGMVESATSPGETVRVKLTDYARCLLLEECNISLHDDNSPVNSILHRNPDYTDSKRFPWLLEVKVYGFDGVARFVMGLPAHTRITDTPRLNDHIRRLTTPV